MRRAPTLGYGEARSTDDQATGRKHRISKLTEISSAILQAAVNEEEIQHPQGGTTLTNSWEPAL
jgi:hypothetical protein